MNGRALTIAVVLGGLLFGTAAAQTQRKPARVGLLSIGTGPSTPLPPQWLAFIDALRDLGYREGENLTLERRFAGGKPELAAGLARELVQASVDVIVGTGVREIRAAADATKTIPIVMVVVPDPVGDGVVASLARPGGNVTGLTFMATGIGGKYVELLREAVPSATRFAVVASRVLPPTFLGELQTAARALNVTVAPQVFVKDRDDLVSVVGRARRDGFGGLIFPLDALTVLHHELIPALAAKNGIPAIYAHPDHVRAGGLMAYGPSFPANFRRAATYVDKILKGARPADLPVEQPRTFDLVLNVRAAKALGVTFPPVLLARADEVLE